MYLFSLSFSFNSQVIEKSIIIPERPTIPYLINLKKIPISIYVIGANVGLNCCGVLFFELFIIKNRLGYLYLCFDRIQSIMNQSLRENVDFNFEAFLNKNFKILLGIAILLNATALFTGVFVGDSALYADVSKYIVQKNDWLNLYAYGSDWLDKPHFPFWVAALSFKVFGVNAFAYKLTAIVFWLIGMLYTFKLSNLIYNKTVAQITVLIYAIALHGVIANFDVRAEPYLTALIIGALYYIYKLTDGNNWKYYCLAALFIGCALMTKGLFVLISIGGGLVIYWIIAKDWKQFINPKWYLLLLLSFIVILPELYALYTQFDLHPEKLVFGRHNVSGLRFFFWDSQFGRFFNTGPIKGSGDKTFFLHTTLWAFLPWSVLFVFSLFRRNKIANPKRWIIAGSALLTFILFSLSKFQLPHYIIILFPHFSMFTAAYFYSLKDKKSFKSFAITQQVIFYIAIAMVILLAYITGLDTAFVISLALAAFIISLFLFRRKQNGEKIFFYSYAFAIVLYLFMNLCFYPFLLNYQGGSSAAKYTNEIQSTIKLGMSGYSVSATTFRFNSDKPVTYLADINQVNRFLQVPHSAVFIEQSNLDSLKMMNKNVEVLQEFDDFHVTQLTLKFLQQSTRKSAVGKTYLVVLKK
ncbi:glycosyl transferase [Arachidicoccus soli]|uniref:Glycosyl transferase n=2 Tax=Arachidicoccus soli TaxID=2341117 RepID=A0A386HKT7_9BACT|nr:glycosyl transferase [Arachidicoccus soli]